MENAHRHHPHEHAHDHADDSHGAVCCGAAAPAGDVLRAQAAARLTFKVQGLDCAEEVAVLKREVGPMVGGEDHLAFDVLNGRMMVLGPAGEAANQGVSVSSEDIRRAVARTGMKAEEWRPEPRDERSRGSPPARAGRVHDVERARRAGGPGSARLAGRRARRGGAPVRPPRRPCHALGGNHRLWGGDPLRAALRGAEGVVLGAAAAPRHEPADGDRRHRRRRRSASSSRPRPSPFCSRCR